MKFDVESGAVKFKLESEKVLVSSRGLSSSCFFPPPSSPSPPTILEFSDTQDSSMPVFRELGIDSATSDDSSENVIVLGWFVLPFVDTNLFQSFCEAVCARGRVFGPWPCVWGLSRKLRGSTSSRICPMSCRLTWTSANTATPPRHRSASSRTLPLSLTCARAAVPRPDHTSTHEPMSRGKHWTPEWVGYVFKCAMRSAWQASKSTTQAVE